MLYLVLFVMFIYCIYNIYLLFQNPTDTFRIGVGNISLEESTAGYIIRDEDVVQGQNQQQNLAQIKNEGERVAIREPVFRYYSNKEENLRKKIDVLNAQIDELLRKETGIFTSSDIEILEKEMQGKLEEVYQETDISKIKELKYTINQTIEKKSKIAGDLSPSGSYIKNLINERAGYESEINSSSEYVTATRSGTVSYRVDGLEKVLVTGDFSYLSKSLLEGLQLRTGRAIPSSSTQGKILDNFKCYVAVVTNSKQAKEVAIGDAVQLRLSNNSEKIRSKIHYIAEEPDGSRILVFEITKGVEELISYRKISMEIVWWSDLRL